MTLYEKAEKSLDANRPVEVMLKSGQVKKIFVTKVNASLGKSSGESPFVSLEGTDMETNSKLVILASDIQDIRLEL